MKGFEIIKRVQNMKEAVETSAELANEGDVVLLSPACASWDMYTSFEVTEWIAQDMKKGDRIKVRFTDIEAVSQIISKELKNREELEGRYLELKRELEEKGII